MIQQIASVMMSMDGLGYKWFASYSVDSFFSVKYFYFILPVIPVFVVNVLAELSLLRASIGKLLMSIKSVRFDKTKASWKQILLRNVFKYSFVTFFYAVLVPFWSLNMFIIHDHFFALCAIFFIGYAVLLIPHRVVVMILQCMDFNVTKQSPLVVFELPIFILRNVAFVTVILAALFSFTVSALLFLVQM